MKNAGNVSLTPAQSRTLEVVRRVGRVLVGCTFSSLEMRGFNSKSAAALARKGALKIVREGHFDYYRVAD